MKKSKDITFFHSCSRLSIETIYVKNKVKLSKLNVLLTKKLTEKS